MNRNKTVFVGLSGGVDSSVAALRLKKQGFNVVGVFIKVWHPEFMVCNWESERLDAMRVAAHLDLPFLTCDAVDTYKQKVADYFISEYVAGRTPNPDVMCNQMVKFGAFLDFAIKKGADFIATGHYAQNVKGQLYRGLDQNKDQSYFLWSLTPKQLQHSLFPIGNTNKEKVRKEALAAGMPTATKKDSQGICFLGHVDIPEFLSHFAKLETGNVLNQSGEIVGTHHGALTYTIGQRQGFEINTSDANRKHMFVVEKNLEQNTITVEEIQPKIQETTTVILNNYILRTEPTKNKTIEVQFRYRQKPVRTSIVNRLTNSLEIGLLEETDRPALGQSCVIYQGDHCLGGGIVGS
jgi:tRNA-uridine 2-sulfurtransferase